jgi:hypothetical protein
MLHRYVVARVIWADMLSIAVTYFITLCLFPGLESEIRHCVLGEWLPILVMAVFNLSDFVGKVGGLPAGGGRLGEVWECPQAEDALGPWLGEWQPCSGTIPTAALWRETPAWSPGRLPRISIPGWAQPHPPPCHGHCLLDAWDDTGSANQRGWEAPRSDSGIGRTQATSGTCADKVGGQSSGVYTAVSDALCRSGMGLVLMTEECEAQRGSWSHRGEGSKK